MALTRIRNTAITLDVNEIPSLPASKITSGTFDDARIAASNVSQHATSFDDNKIVNDISSLALREASNNDRASYNTNSSYVDVFQDASGIDTTTNVTRNASEYVSSVQSSLDTSVKFLITGNGTGSTIVDATGNHSLTNNGVTWSTTEKKFGTSSLYFDGSSHISMSDSANFYYGNSGNGWTYETWYNLSSSTGFLYQQSIHSGNGNPRNHIQINNTTSIFLYDSSSTLSDTVTVPDVTNGWQHFALVYDGSNIQIAVDGVWQGSPISYSSPSNNSNSIKFGQGQNSSGSTLSMTGYIDGIKVSEKNQYTLGTNFTPPTAKFDDQVLTVSSTGNFTGTTVTAPSSVSEMGAIITYQDQAGTNALNTDIVLQLSADGGSNYTTATLEALPDFSTGIKMAKVNDLAVTAGTQLKYKISFANQASGSKEARIRGVSLQY